MQNRKTFRCPIQESLLTKLRTMSILFIKALKGNLSCCHVNKLRHFWTWWCIKYEITNLNHKWRWKNWIIIDPSLGLAQFTMKNSTQQSHSHSLHHSLSFLVAIWPIAFYDSLDLAVIIPKWDFFIEQKIFWLNDRRGRKSAIVFIYKIFKIC